MSVPVAFTPALTPFAASVSTTGDLRMLPKKAWRAARWMFTIYFLVQLSRLGESHRHCSLGFRGSGEVLCKAQ